MDSLASKPQLSTQDQEQPCMVWGWCEKGMGSNQKPPFVLSSHRPTDVRGQTCLWAYGVSCHVVGS